MKRIVLIADNDPDFLDTRAEFLEAKGYKVHKAESIERAEKLLESTWLHLAVIDLRLRNDADPQDESGLTLAKTAAYRAVPKIILTRWPTYEAVREALGSSVEELPPAINFIAKQEGPQAMLGAIDQAFQRDVQLNADLSIHYGEGALTFLYLASLIDSGLDDEVMLQRSEEMEGLFRRLFQKEKGISIDRLLWQKDHVVAMTVFIHTEGKKPESLMIVCGKAACISAEATRYHDFAPAAPSRNATVLTRSLETLHYGANAYVLAGSEVESLQTLKAVYDSGPDKSFNAALTTLFETVLVDWHQEQRIVDETRSIGDIYGERLAWIPSDAAHYKECVHSIIRKSLTLGDNIELSGGRLLLHFLGETYSYLDPGPFLLTPLRSHLPVLMVTTPGELSGKNILVGEGSNVWLTDFAGAGLAPLLWNFISLEAVIRFDWIKPNRLQWLHQMERHLISSEFGKLYASEVEAPLRKPLRAIQNVRRLASRHVGDNHLAYHMGILFQAIHRLVTFTSSSERSNLEIGQLAHVLLASSMILEVVARNAPSRRDSSHRVPRGILINKSTREVWVNGVRVSLRGQSYDLLCNLYDHANISRTRREIIEEVFRERYDETDASQIGRLNTAIHRLRDRIEVDPFHPRYLLTEPMLGYRLVTELPSE